MILINSNALLDNWIYRDKHGDRVIDPAAIKALQERGDKLMEQASPEVRETIKGAEKIIVSFLEREVTHDNTKK